MCSVMCSVTSVSNFLRYRVNKHCTNIIYYHFFFPVCHDVLTVNHSHGILESLNYPNDYPLNERCNWTIQATKGNTLNYSFTAFDLEDGSDCDRDFLKVCTHILETNQVFSNKEKTVRMQKTKGKFKLLKFSH